jgi:Helix-turn-helix domain
MLAKDFFLVERQMTRSRTSQLLTTGEAAELLRLKPHTLENMRCEGTGPLFRKHGCRVFYLRSEIMAWSKQRRRQIASGVAV